MDYVRSYPEGAPRRDEGAGRATRRRGQDLGESKKKPSGFR